MTEAEADYRARPKLMSFSEFEALAQRVNNWGRWGPDDQLGTLNFLTPERRAAAAAEVRDGTLVSCACDISGAPRIDDPRPPLHVPFWNKQTESMQVSLEALTIQPHGSTITHLDALCHLAWYGKTYNGHPVNPFQANAGAAMNSIMVGSGGIMGRGVLIDLAAAKGKEFMELGEVANLDDIQRALDRQKCEVLPGDIIFFRTGKQARVAKKGHNISMVHGSPGVDVDAIEWVHKSEVAASICDSGTDPQPTQVDGVRLPWHVTTLVHMGLMIVDNANLEPLHAACEEKQRWTFMAALAPLRVLGANSSPINPLALF